MFPWYTGTSADMFRTIFGLVVSLKLFLGRFDMRTMQVRRLVRQRKSCLLKGSYVVRQGMAEIPWECMCDLRLLEHRVCPSTSLAKAHGHSSMHCCGCLHTCMPRQVHGWVANIQPALPDQAAVGVAPPGSGREAPREGDGFTYEHLKDRSHLWIDFCADTGDGGCGCGSRKP